MSNIHTLADLKDDGPSNESFPNAWGGGGGQSTSGQRFTSGGGTGGGNGGGGNEASNLLRPDGTYWSWNWPADRFEHFIYTNIIRPMEWYHLLINCCCPCFIGPPCSDARKSDYKHLFRCFTFYVFWICLIYFIVEMSCGFWAIDFVANPPSPWKPAGEQTQILINLGAKDSQQIQRGHVWRLFTSMFMHGGILHFCFNMYVVIQMGLGYERDWWFWRMAPIYIFSGLFGGIFSCMFKSVAVSVGASGAIIGFLFAKISNVICIWKKLKNQERIMHASTVVMIIFFTVIMTVLNPKVDWAGHLGGAMMGFCLGFVAFANHIENKAVKWTLAIIFGLIALILFIVFGVIFWATNAITFT